MTEVDHIYRAICSLPLTDRLRLVERVVHDAAETTQARVAEPPVAKPSLLGLFADVPELVDQVCELAMQDRATRKLRTADG